MKNFVRNHVPLAVSVYRKFRYTAFRRKPAHSKYQEEYEAIARSNLFDNCYYLSTNPDVAATKIDPLLHYLLAGSREGRRPTHYFCPREYYETNPDVRESGTEAFYHWVVNGRFEGRLPRVKGVLSEVAEDDDYQHIWRGYHSLKAISQYRAESGQKNFDTLSFCQHLSGSKPSSIAAKINFEEGAQGEEPMVSVVIPCFEQGMYTLECLSSINARHKGTPPCEVLIIDNHSKDEAYSAIRAIRGIKYHRMERNLGFGEACNFGVQRCKGKYILILNNDAQLAPNAIAVLVAAYENQFENPGVIGPKILSFDGTLQEAGCCINADGSGELIGFGGDPGEPRFGYPRRVEYVSGVALFMSREDFLKVGGFDKRFSPAYCEDTDLCLKVRRLGKSIYYEPAAVVAHHLSVTANKISSEFKSNLAIRNKQLLVEKWQSELCEHSIRLLAFYLPQYHPIPENDRWWGKGFTEWRNVTKAVANYSGHYQPRHPADLGYYDLRVPEVMEQQAALAQKYGLAGFCYYYYWFNGRRMLDMPLERLLETGRPNFPFCLCWANENWTRTWDGMEQDVLMEQKYSEENDHAVIEDIARYLRHPAYIKVNGRPLLLVYRVKEFPNFSRTANTWRNYCRANGFGEICLAMVESFELSAWPEDPSNYGCDISVEFPPHQMVHDKPLPLIDKREDFSGAAHDYENLALQYMTRKEAGFKRLRSVLVGWDNTPRRQDKSLVLENATPGTFQAWLEWTIKRTKEQNFGDERIIFINAWNEWCEGAYLEPDQRYGHAYLQAIKNALDSHYNIY